MTDAVTSAGDVAEILKPAVNTLLTNAGEAAKIPYAGLEGYGEASGGDTPFAGINTLLGDSYKGAESLTPAGELKTATGIATLAGNNANNAGADYLKSAGNAGTVNTYMSPFMSNVVEQQKRAAMRDAARKMPGQMAQGIRSGGRGGTRDALLQAESNRGLQESLQKIQAEGSEKAFNNAQDIIKTGADVGLRGYSTGIAAANSLNTIGSNVFGQNKDAIMTKNTLGNDIYNKEDAVRKAKYADWQAMMNNPMERAKFMSGIISQIPISNRQVQPGSDSNSDLIKGLVSAFTTFFGNKP
jgi:hypothetical protein